MNNCDQIIHAGDIMQAQTLEAFSVPLTAVKGNNDAHLNFADVATLEFDSGKIVIEHGHEHGWQTPSHDSLRQAHPDAKIVIYGHTHKQVIDTKSTPWIINPGASGKVRNGGSSKCLILTIDDSKKWMLTPLSFLNKHSLFYVKNYYGNV
jgi:putative phosphoesterase